MQVHIAHEFAVRSRDGASLPAEELHSEGARLMEALLDLEKVDDDIADATTSTDADRGAVVAEMLVSADEEGAALRTFLAVVRTAIHAIGGATPGWDGEADQGVDYRPQGVQLEYV